MWFCTFDYSAEEINKTNAPSVNNLNGSGYQIGGSFGSGIPPLTQVLNLMQFPVKKIIMAVLFLWEWNPWR